MRKLDFFSGKFIDWLNGLDLELNLLSKCKVPLVILNCRSLMNDILFDDLDAFIDLFVFKKIDINLNVETLLHPLEAYLPKMFDSIVSTKSKDSFFWAQFLIKFSAMISSLNPRNERVSSGWTLSLSNLNKYANCESFNIVEFNFRLLTDWYEI